MGFDNVNVNVSGPVQPTSTYKTKVLKGNHSFASQVTEPNTIYVIKYDFDLDGASVTIPANCVLQFDGGSLSNGTLTGQNTGIQTDLVKIFNTDVYFAGSWKLAEIYLEWFGSTGKNDDIDDIVYFSKAFELSNYSNHAAIELIGTYFVATDLDIPIYSRVFSNKKATIKVGTTIIVRNRTIIEGLTLSAKSTTSSLITLRRDESLSNISFAMYTYVRDLFFKGGSITSKENKVLDGITIDTSNGKSMAWIYIDNIIYTDHYRYGLHMQGTGWITCTQMSNSLFDNCNWTVFNEIDNTIAGITFIDCMSEGNPDHCVGVVYVYKGSFNSKGFEFGDHWNTTQQGHVIDYKYLIGHASGKINGIDVYNAGFNTNNIIEVKPRDIGVVAPVNEVLEGDLLQNSIAPLLANTTKFTTLHGKADLHIASDYFKSNKIVFNNNSSNIFTKFLHWTTQQARTEVGIGFNTFGNYFVIPPAAVYNPDNVAAYAIDHAKELFIAKDINTLKEHVFERKDADSINFNWKEIFLPGNVGSAEFIDDTQTINKIVNSYDLYYLYGFYRLVIKVGNKFIDAAGYTPTYHRGNSLSQVTKVLNTVNESYNKGFDYFINSEQRKVFWNGTKWVTADGRSYAILYGALNSAPLSVMTGFDTGYQYYATDLRIPLFYAGSPSRFFNALGFTAAKTKGTSSERPTSSLYTSTDEGFEYFDTDLKKPIYLKVVNSEKTWVEADGATAGVARSGASTSRPVGSSIYVGFMFFDTTLGKPIYAKAISGDTVTWVDTTGAPV